MTLESQIKAGFDAVATDVKQLLSDTKEFNYASDRVQIKVAPVVPERAGNPTWGPTTGTPYLNVILAPDGPSDTARVWRSTLVGTSVASLANGDFDRVEAFGDGAVRFADYLDSVTAIGSLAFQWLGVQPEGGETVSQALRRTTHDFVDDHDITDPNWDFVGLETRNPGLRLGLEAVPLSTTKAHNENNVGVGRNAGLHLIKGANNTFVGKNCMAHAYRVDNSIAMGYNAARDGALQDRAVFLGTRAGELWSEGSGNTVIGYHAGGNINSGSYNMLLGNFSAWDYTGHVDWLFRVGMGAAGAIPLLSGDFETRKLGIGLEREDIQATGLHIRVGTSTGYTVNNGADELVIESDQSVMGITLLSSASSISQIAFGDTNDNVGNIRYYHSENSMKFYAGDVETMLLQAGKVILPGLPTSSAGLTAGQLWNSAGTLKVA